MLFHPTRRIVVILARLRRAGLPRRRNDGFELVGVDVPVVEAPTERDGFKEATRGAFTGGDDSELDLATLGRGATRHGIGV